MSRDFDIVVYGASGFTGRLVAEYLAGAGVTGWAMAGRSEAKLAEVREAVGAPGDTPLLVADADDVKSLADLAARSRVVITSVGPYQLYGSELVAACATAGTAYADLCGEPAWMRHMIDAHQDAARKSGARIVFSCGFDSIPFDLGVFSLQECAMKKHGAPAPRVKGRVRHVKGGASGGTVASLKATMAAAARDPGIIKLLTSPFALTPGFSGPHQPTGLIPEYDSTLGTWVAPFIMAPINTKNVHRTNFLLDHAWGRDFVYDEMMVAPGIGDMAKAAAETIAKYNPLTAANAPRPGEGPSQEERESGGYDILFAGLMPDGKRIDTVVTGDRDPGYGSTSKMIAETARCLLETEGEGGVWTPGALLGAKLRERLEANAGLSFRSG